MRARLGMKARPTGMLRSSHDRLVPPRGVPCGLIQLARVVHLLRSPHRQDQGRNLASQRQPGQIQLRPSAEKLPVMSEERIAFPGQLDDRGRCALEDLLQRAVEVPVQAPRLLHRQVCPTPIFRPYPVGGTPHVDAQAGIDPEGTLVREAIRRHHHRQELGDPNRSQVGASLQDPGKSRAGATPPTSLSPRRFGRRLRLSAARHGVGPAC